MNVLASMIGDRVLSVLNGSFKTDCDLEVARALALNPKLLLLDEPLARLNQSESSSLADLIKALCIDGLTRLAH